MSDIQKIYLQRFESVSEFKVTTANRSLSTLEHKSCASQTEGDVGFYGCEFDEAIALCEKGWPEGAKKLAPAQFSAEAGTEKFMEPVYDVAGDDVDVGRFVEGDPECMISYEVREKQGKTVRIGFSCCYSCGTATETIIKCGREVVAAVDAAEREGYRVELTAEWAIAGGGKYNESIILTQVVVKQAQDALDIDSVAFVIAHPSAFRRMVFGVWEQLPTAVREGFNVVRSGGYGRVHHRNEADAGYDKYFKAGR